MAVHLSTCILVLLLVIANISSIPCPTEDDTRFELVFLIDTSLRLTELGQVKSCVVQIINNLADSVKVAAISFSGMAEKVFDFVDLSSARKLLINDIQSQEAVTEDSAQHTFRIAEQLSNGTDGVEKIYLFVIQNEVTSKQRFIEAATATKRNGIKVMVLAFGDTVVEEFLTAVVSKPVNSSYFIFAKPETLMTSVHHTQAIVQSLCDLASYQTDDGGNPPKLSKMAQSRKDYQEEGNGIPQDRSLTTQTTLDDQIDTENEQGETEFQSNSKENINGEMPTENKAIGITGAVGLGVAVGVIILLVGHMIQKGTRQNSDRGKKRSIAEELQPTAHIASMDTQQSGVSCESSVASVLSDDGYVTDYQRWLAQFRH